MARSIASMGPLLTAEIFFTRASIIRVLFAHAYMIEVMVHD